jgi:hypothetical protein
MLAGRMEYKYANRIQDGGGVGTSSLISTTAWSSSEPWFENLSNVAQ